MNTAIEPFQDRTSAGKILARRLLQYSGRADVVILALSPCGLPVAAEVARALRCPMDMIMSRRLELPGGSLSAGAVSCEGVRVLNDDVIEQTGLDQHGIEQMAARELSELHRQEMAYRGRIGAPHLPGKTILLVADCAVAGASLLAAVRILRVEEPAKIIVAVPVLSGTAAGVLRPEVDDLVALDIRDSFCDPRECYDEACVPEEALVKTLPACAVPGPEVSAAARAV